MINHKGYLFFLEILLDIILVMGVIALVTFSLVTVFSMSQFSSLDLRTHVFAIIDCAFYLLIVYELKNILNKVFEEKPFIINNVKSFRRIAYYIFAIGFVDMINNIISRSFRILFVINKNGSVKPDILVFIILGCVFLVTGDIFEKAIKIKDENDLTI
ncbi:DUF2975 domain-containing protein [Clostridium sp. WILCCON 0269]|uniref:DUF2975 domain-containing protein n=1 Tax=Candidatus Clostridium eludens TaxID=3381663 RepID=A0ABW8SPM4_9CLOT